MLPDQTTFTPDTVTGKVRTRIVQLLLMAATGLTEAGFEELKARLAGSDS